MWWFSIGFQSIATVTRRPAHSSLHWFGMQHSAPKKQTPHSTREFLDRREFLAAAASVICAAPLVRAQQDEATFTTGVKVVNVLATVRTKKNEIVRDLTKDDFTLSENGRPQTIRYFSKETDLPLTVGLMVDTSMS